MGLETFPSLRTQPNLNPWTEFNRYNDSCQTVQFNVVECAPSYPILKLIPLEEPKAQVLTNGY